MTASSDAARDGRVRLPKPLADKVGKGGADESGSGHNVFDEWIHGDQFQ